MKSIAEIFDNSKELLDSISNFIDKYIGSSLLRKCGITKVIDSVTEKTTFEYAGPCRVCGGKPIPDVQDRKFFPRLQKGYVLPL